MQKILKLNEEVKYADNSVVSNTVINKKTGTVTLFAFDKGQSLSEHTTPFDAMVNVIDGKADIVIGGESHTLSAGLSVVMPANIPHALNAVEKFKMLLVMIKE